MRSSRDESRDSGRHSSGRDSSSGRRTDDRDRRVGSGYLSSSSSTSMTSIKRLKTSSTKDSPSNSTSKLATNSPRGERPSSAANEPKVDIQKLSMEAMLAEEDEAIHKTTAEHDLKEFRLKCNSIRDICHQVLEAKIGGDQKTVDALRVKGSLQFLALKTLNRFDKYRSRDARDRLQTAKQKVDTFHLQLQNLLYEVMHLQRECNTCLAFRSKDEDIDLVPVAEFEATADEELRERATDQHSTHLARLEWELRQRKQLASELKSAEEVKNGAEAEIVVKRETLDKLQPMLKSIVEATQPLYAELNLPLQANDSAHAMAQYLSRPLYVLYLQLISYKHANRSPFSVKINGTVEDVKTFELTTKAEEEEDNEEQQEDEEAGGRSRKSKKSRHRRKSTSHSSGKSLFNKLVACHPLTVELTIASNGSTLRCLFSFALRLEIVCAKVSVDQSSGHSPGAHLEVVNHQLLSHLMSDPEDDGLQSPNPANDHTIKAYGVHDFSSLTGQLGFAYKWCQSISGLDFMTSYARNTSNALSINSMDQTVKAITRRFESRLALQKQLCHLDRNSLDLPGPLATESAATQVMSQIHAFKEITREDYHRNCRVADNIITDSMDLDQCFLYRALVERGSASLTALIVLPLDYPKNPPFFNLSIGEQASDYQKSAADPLLRDLEQLINCWCAGHCEASGQQSVAALLSYQMHRLQLGFDTYLEAKQGGSCGAAGGAEGPKEFPIVSAVVAKGRTGRDHCISYHIDANDYSD